MYPLDMELNEPQKYSGCRIKRKIPNVPALHSTTIHFTNLTAMVPCWNLHYAAIVGCYENKWYLQLYGERYR
jgi:hypothetical protein